MKSVLNAPMRPRAQRQVCGAQLTGADVVTPLGFGHLVGDHALRHDTANGLAGRPVAGVDDPFCGSHPSELSDPTAVRTFAMLMPRLFSRQICESLLDRRVQGRRVTFHRQEIIAFLSNDLCGDGLLATHRINRHPMPLEVERLEQLGNGGDLVAFGDDLFLAENDAPFRSESADHVNGGFSTTARSTHGLAVDRQGAAQGADDTRNPTTKSRLELFRVENPEDAQKGLFRWNAVLQHEKAAQPGLFLARPIGDIFDRIRIREHGRDGNHQNLLKVMQSPVARLARIVQFAQTTHQTCAIRPHHFHRPKNESRPDLAGAYKTQA